MSIFDVSQEILNEQLENLITTTDAAGAIVILLDEQGAFAIKNVASLLKGGVSTALREGPNGLTGFKIMIDILAAAQETLEKCVKNEPSDLIKIIYDKPH